MPIFNCIKRVGKSSVPSSMTGEEKEARMFSHVEASERIQDGFSPKINTFQSLRKEVIGMAVFRIVGLKPLGKFHSLSLPRWSGNEAPCSLKKKARREADGAA